MSIIRYLLSLTLSASPLAAQVTPHETDSLVQSSNTFAFELQKPMMAGRENVIFSPFSIYYALSMACSGAEGKTRETFEQALHWPSERGRVAKQLQTLCNNLYVSQENLIFSQNNALFMNPNLELCQPFKSLLQNSYAAEINVVDFLSPLTTAAMINDWVATATWGKIDHLINPSDLGPDLRLMLINTLYFRGKWQVPFDENLTQKKPFFIDNQRQTTVEMMSQAGVFQYLENDNEQVIVLPFSCEDSTCRPLMVIALPKPAVAFHPWYSNLCSSTVHDWLNDVSYELLDLQLPRFSLRLHQNLGLVLKQIGLDGLFRDTADFSSISQSSSLCFDQVIHEAHIDINELGVEAGAATSISMRLTSCFLPCFPTFFLADHPFAFFIIDEATGVILFQGTCVDPST